MGELEHLSVECNKLTHPIFNFSNIHNLKTLRLAGNPLKNLPDLSCLKSLSSFSVANVRIESRGEPGHSLDSNHISIALAEDSTTSESSTRSSFMLAPFSRTASPRSRWSSFIEIIFRTTSCQHPLIAAAIVRVAREPSCAQVR